jgi:hypothetical protein
LQHTNAGNARSKKQEARRKEQKAKGKNKEREAGNRKQENKIPKMCQDIRIIDTLHSK